MATTTAIYQGITVIKALPQHIKLVITPVPREVPQRFTHNHKPQLYRPLVDEYHRPFQGTIVEDILKDHTTTSKSPTTNPHEFQRTLDGSIVNGWPLSPPLKISTLINTGQ